MTYRRKLFLIIFAAGILPTLTVLAISTYVINSSLNRIGASGLENSFQTASVLIEQTQELAGELLRTRLADTAAWPRHNQNEIDRWRNNNYLDLAFYRGLDTFLVSVSDSIPLTGKFTLGDFPTRNGASHIEKDGRYFLVYSTQDHGGGMLMPSGYSRLGHELAASYSASASLGLYKGFSLKLLAIVSAAVIVCMLVMALVISTLLSRQMAKPLEKLHEGTIAYANGHFDYRIDVGSRDEFVLLAESFSKMAGEIKLNQQKLLTAERLAAWREVARRIAHEIRNPLTPINIELYRLKKMYQAGQFPAVDEMTRMLDAIGSQVAVLQELSTQFSTFAKEPELKRGPCSLKDIITESVNIAAVDDSVKIATVIPDDLPCLMLDTAMMRRVFLNILKNAAESGPSMVEILIEAVRHDPNIIIAIHDNGPGFPAEKLARIDQPYLTTKKTGTGLGMVIIKKIINEHGGQVRFYNDTGAVVEISLPI